LLLCFQLTNMTNACRVRLSGASRKTHTAHSEAGWGWRETGASGGGWLSHLLTHVRSPARKTPIQLVFTRALRTFGGTSRSPSSISGGKGERVLAIPFAHGAVSRLSLRRVEFASNAHAGVVQEWEEGGKGMFVFQKVSALNFLMVLNPVSA